MPRPILALIDIAAMQHNLTVLRQHAPGAKLCAVIKANAYGHGIERILPALSAADALAMLDLEEAQRVRNAGWRKPIWLLEGVFESGDLDLCSRLGLWHTVHHSSQIEALSRHRSGEPQRVFLKLNSGMNRLGFPASDYRAAWSRLKALPQVADVSHATHFSDADGAVGVQHQMQVFAQVTQGLPGACSMANSAALLRHPASHADWVRPGIALYGASPDPMQHSPADWGLQPVMSLRTRLLAVQNLQAGDSVGYGSTFIADRPLRVGIAACGYADGYPRLAATGTPVLINGCRSRTVGRISMDMLTVDLSPCPQADVGAEVTLWGTASDGTPLPVDEVAAAAGTLSYELLAGLAQRVPTSIFYRDTEARGDKH